LNQRKKLKQIAAIRGMSILNELEVERVRRMAANANYVGPGIYKVFQTKSPIAGDKRGWCVQVAVPNTDGALGAPVMTGKYALYEANDHSPDLAMERVSKYCAEWKIRPLTQVHD